MRRKSICISIPYVGMRSQGEDFTKTIRKEIRKAFAKMGVIVGCTVTAVVLFILFALPYIVDLFYYDPGKIVAEKTDEEGAVSQTNRMSLDMAVYTELMLPEARRDYVDVDDKGYGRYDIYDIYIYCQSCCF